MPRPDSGCESIPRFLHRLGVDVLLLSAAGPMAQRHCQELGIRLIPGRQGRDPEQVAMDFLAASPDAELIGENSCTASEHAHRHCHDQ